MARNPGVIYVVIDPEIGEKLNRYLMKHSTETNKTQVIEKALKNYLKKQGEIK